MHPIFPSLPRATGERRQPRRAHRGVASPFRHCERSEDNPAGLIGACPGPYSLRISGVIQGEEAMNH